MKGFPTRSPSALEQRPLTQQWLVAGLWGRHAVGIIGGEPKCGKSFLALDLAVAVAVAVAAGVSCLRRFETDQSGPVLMFAAEDAGHIVRTRLQGIARTAGADFDTHRGQGIVGTCASSDRPVAVSSLTAMAALGRMDGGGSPAGP